MRFHSRAADTFSVPLTPLIDVVFLLLLFFILTTSFSQINFLSVQLPQAAADSDQTEHHIKLAIDAMGGHYLDGQPMPADMRMLGQRLRERLAQHPDAMVTIYAHALTAHQAVVQLMALARAQGVSQVGIATMGEHLP